MYFVSFSPDVKEVFKASLEQAAKLNDGMFVAPEHILLGLLIVVNDRGASAMKFNPGLAHEKSTKVINLHHNVGQRAGSVRK